MEKKTIGGFIAALRKANGMTQRDLAERLHVSDKTVSRWECGDGAPDLSLIPVIAEIFDITCDELLCGERRSPGERTENLPETGSSPRAEKQRRRLLKEALSDHRGFTCVAAGISAMGLLVALVCDLAFMRATLGFLCGALFITASLVCQAFFTNQAFLAVEDAELENAALADFRRRVTRHAEISIGFSLGLIGFTLPLLLADSYQGLRFESLLRYGAPLATALVLLFVVACFFLNAALVKRGFYPLSAPEAEAFWQEHRLKKAVGGVLAVSLALTFLAQQAATQFSGPLSVAGGQTFEDYDSFIAFMEQEVPAPDGAANGTAEGIGPVTWYDENGNAVTEEEARRRTLTDRNGAVVCTYTQRNDTVASLRYSAQDGTVLPITVCTYSDLQIAREKIAARNKGFAVLCCLEAAAALLFYRRKRADHSPA